MDKPERLIQRLKPDRTSESKKLEETWPKLVFSAFSIHV